MGDHRPGTEKGSGDRWWSRAGDHGPAAVPSCWSWTRTGPDMLIMNPHRSRHADHEPAQVPTCWSWIRPGPRTVIMNVARSP